MIKNIIFDFGNVLVHHDLHPMLSCCFGNDSEAMDKFHTILSDREFVDACDRGVTPFGRMVDNLIRQYPEYKDAFLYFRDNYLDEITGEVEGMRQLLLRLKSEGYKLYGLTNWSDTIYKVMDKFDIFQLLDGRVISCEEHSIKPEKEIYLRLCEKYGLNPDECLFTDDRISNVEGAKAVGMYAVIFTDCQKFISDIRQIIAF
jgi:HAD superfamily hydrolase (TIGR01509 family)